MFTISKSEFKDVHNGLCMIRNLCDQVDGVLDPKIVEKIQNAILLLDNGLRSVYDQENKWFHNKISYFGDIASRQGFKTAWSMYSVNDIYESSGYIANTLVVNDKEYPMQSMLSWLELWKLVDAAVVEQKDHHFFIEDFVCKDGKLTVILGS
jgi:hypothetical protein